MFIISTIRGQNLHRLIKITGTVKTIHKAKKKKNKKKNKPKYLFSKDQILMESANQWLNGINYLTIS